MLQFLQVIQVGGPQASILALPLVVRRVGDPVVSPDLVAGHPASASFMIDTILDWVNFDWRMGTFSLGRLLCQNILRLIASIYGELAWEAAWERRLLGG